MYGEPQAIRINPAVQSEWYYIVKSIANVLGNAKANRVYEMAYKGLYTSLTSLKHEMERENNSK